MSKILFSALVGVAALIGLPSLSFAQHHGGGHSGGGHGGSVHGGATHSGSGHGGSSWHGNSGWHGGNYGHHNGYGWGLGLGYWPSFGYGYGSRPYYYGGYGADYYYGPSDYVYDVPAYTYTAPTVVVPAEGQQAIVNTNTTALLEVKVPASAELWFDGVKTAQTGALRHFETPVLEPGRSFVYDVRARWTDTSGRVVDRTRQVTIRAGARMGVDFNNQ